MPHAEDSGNLTNGEKHQSQFLNHLTSLPVVADTISTLKSNPQIKTSLNYAHQAQEQYINPVLATKPVIQAHSIIHPYAAAADGLGDKGLTKVEERFPLIKEDSATVRDVLVRFALAPVLFPLAYARWGLDWVSETYAKEVKNYDGTGNYIIVQGKAVVGTGLTAVEETAVWVRGLLEEGKGKAVEAKEKVANGVKEAQ